MGLNILLVVFSIIVLSRIIYKKTGLVDILLYVILGLLFSKIGFINKEDLTLKFLSEVGVIFLMFYAGWHEDSKTFLKKVWENKYLALIAALGPFLGAYISFYLLNFSFYEALIAGFIFTATAVPYTIGILNSLNLNKTSGAKSILAAAMADDFLSIILVSASFSALILLETSNNPDLFSIFTGTFYQLFLLLISFMIFFVMATFILPQTNDKPTFKYDNKFINSFHLFACKIRNQHGINKFVNTYVEYGLMIPTALFLLFALGILAHLFGLHVAIGAYLAGLILTQDMFAINKEDDPSFAGNVCYESYKELDKFIYNLTVNFLGPIFFIFLGAQLSIESNNIGEVLIFSLVVFLFVSFFQVSSAYLAAKKTTDLDTKNSLLVGFGMLPRDVLAFVILEIAISNKLIDPGTIYSTVIVISILLLNLVTPLFLGYLKKKYKKEFEDEISKIK